MIKLLTKIKNLPQIIVYLYLVGVPTLTQAYSIRDPQEGGIVPIEPGDTANINWLQSIGAIVINTLLVICGAIAVAVIAYAGVRYITAGGDTAKAEKAKSQVIWALVGLVVISFSWLALQATISIFGLNDYSNARIPQVVY